MKHFRDTYLKGLPDVAILDVGSRRVRRSQQSYRRLFPAPFTYTGMDIVPGRNVDIVGYDQIDMCYDVVISGQVIEHTAWPWQWLKDLKQYFSMYICIIGPIASKEHRYPIDTFRILPDGMRALFDWAGITAIEIERSKGDTIGIGRK